MTAERLDATARGGDSWVLHGPAGIGKTHLLHRAVARLKDRGCLVLSATCVPEDAGGPFTPLTSALRPAHPGPHPVVEVLGRGGPGAPSTTPTCAHSCSKPRGQRHLDQGFRSGAGVASHYLNSIDPETGLTYLQVADQFGTRIAGTLGEVSTGMEQAQQLVGGVGELRDGPQQLADGNRQLAAGVEQLATQLPEELASQMGQLRDGLGQISGGANELLRQTRPLVDKAPLLASGSRELLGGIRQLNSQVGALPDGVNQLAAGTSQLSDAAAQLGDGSRQLYLGTLAYVDGVWQYTQGVGQVAGGVVQLADGIDELGDGAGLRRCACRPQSVGGGAAFATGALASVLIADDDRFRWRTGPPDVPPDREFVSRALSSFPVP